MATITINIPDNILPRVLNGFAYSQGYVPILEDGSTNPETKAQFARRKLIEYIKSSVAAAEIEAARNQAATEAANKANTEIALG